MNISVTVHNLTGAWANEHMGDKTCPAYSRIRFLSKAGSQVEIDLYLESGEATVLARAFNAIIAKRGAS